MHGCVVIVQMTKSKYSKKLLVAFMLRWRREGRKENRSWL